MPELHEPYEDYLYADLRHELSVRQIRLPRSGPQRIANRATFIKLLRDWDKKKNETPTQMTTRRTQSSNSQINSLRVSRSRRGCRFRLINVLLSPDFSGRWGAMTTSTGKLEVNQLWLDVHAAFLTQNSVLDTLQFQDPLFVNVTPNVIVGHSASRLLQMWVEIVAMYRNAVAQSKEAAATNDSALSFFDFCAGRLDLLYLHMAMLLEPKLSKFILSDKLPIPKSLSTTKIKTSATTVSTAVTIKPKGAAKRITTVPDIAKAKGSIARSHAPSATATAAATPSDAVAATVTPSAPSRVPKQNPEMQEISTLACSQCPARPNMTKAETSKVCNGAKPNKRLQKSAAMMNTQKASKEAMPTSARVIGTAKDAKAKISPSKLEKPVFQPKEKNVSKPQGAPHAEVNKKSLGKRQRDEETAIVQISSSSDIVPHSSKRMHSATRISSSLATRQMDVMLPPDEWDILEGRLRKVNENIDRCHHGLASSEVKSNDNYKLSLEADLRFYSAIKQRLQEQLLVVMQSGY
ncbi:hypothetical protein PsorP6_007515 [Peronosclerospora sorghi]|uniref:Uncharacterized protein n=1 Tax=Peronosclerospora sorghi TaxID=230839 RepID=A0ACC0WAZ5_9STRA|nr:hypothetical protein PsorP6_007515 [Peronosclerospora sorghi]